MKNETLRLLETARANTLRVRELIRAEFDTDPESYQIRVRCAKCGVDDVELDYAETVKASVTELRPVWFKCHECEIRDDLLSRGVPELYLGACLNNWEVRHSYDGYALSRARDFAKGHKGFFVLASETFGNGKTHLAIAIMRQFYLRGFASRFITQGEALLALRKQYRDREAEDIIGALKDVAFLVVDDVGVSVGGRDEKPALYEILSDRYVRQRPTVLTTNMRPDEVVSIVGEGMASRLRESTTAWVEIHAGSARKEKRKQYLGGNNDAGNGTINETAS